MKKDNSEIKAKVNDILRDRKNGNLILDLLAVFEKETSSSSAISAVVSGLGKVFDHFIRRGDIKEQPEGSDQYGLWIRDLYDEAFRKMLELFHHEKPNIGDSALVNCMKWIVAFHEKNASGKTHWVGEDVKRLRAVLESLCSKTRPCKRIISRFQEYLEYVDVKQHVIRGLLKILKKEPEIANPIFMDNLMSLLELINFQCNKKKEEVGPTLICHNPEGDSIFEYVYEPVQKSFSSLWEEFLKRRLTIDLYKRVLIILHDKVMPYLTRPLLLTDFLINSYNVGGSISLLALNGVFTLIQNYNLEYPNFYEKLYALFTPEVLHVKYKARFFHLADLFLTSTHLPEYLVAAFVKRLSRLSLTAPANSLLMVFPFIGNLILRHRGLTKMIDGGGMDLESDPYDPEEKDLSKCRAVESQLWEIETMQSHVLPQVSQAAKFISKKLPEIEWDTSEFLELTMQEMMEKETKKRIFVNVPLTFERPDGLKFPKNERIAKYFALA